MQRFNAKLSQNLFPLIKMHLIAWGGEQWFLPFFILSAFVRAIAAGLTRKIDCIYIADGLLAPLGLVLKKILGRPVVVTIHGRDIAFPMKIYQAVVPWSLKRLDKVVCVSEQLKQECLKRGVPEDRLTVAANGVDIDDFNVPAEADRRDYFEKLTQTSFKGRKILITVGRLVRKKGVDSFLQNILPLVLRKHPDILYLIAGDGPLKPAIEKIIEARRLEKTAFLLGQIDMDSGLLPALYNLADIFVMPNVRVADDMEGFGIVALEAGAAGLAVVASNVDGIAQAIVDNHNGLLVELDHYETFAEKVSVLLNNDASRKSLGERARGFVEANYSWKHIAAQYVDIFNKVKSGHG